MKKTHWRLVSGFMFGIAVIIGITFKQYDYLIIFSTLSIMAHTQSK